MKCLGVDLGWTSGASGLCCLDWTGHHFQVVSLERQVALEDILTWIEAQVTSHESAVVAVDAPTLIPNQTGMRLPDRLAHQYLGRYHAGCYPANLRLAFAERTTGFGRRLEALEFIHDPTITHRQPQGRYQLEVFPHAAMVHLFKLDRILKYKKGRIAERRIGLIQLRAYILDVLPRLEPALSCLEPQSHQVLIPEVPLKGTDLKALEDQLDSLICAYAAAHWWYWGLEKNWVLGDRTTGYIVIPTPFGKRGVIPKADTSHIQAVD
jgi:predicted RNase H-like nuclease